MARADKFTAATLPRLELTKDDEHEMHQLCDELEREVLASYEEFLYAHNRQVDRRRWKPVRAKDDLTVYRERRASSRHGASSSSSGSARVSSDMFYSSSSNGSSVSPSRPESQCDLSATMEIGPLHATAATSRMPVVMVAGTAPGTLDDALLGISVTDTPAIRRKSVYQKDKLEDCAVVATLNKGSYEDPFQFRGILWFLKDYPILNAIVKPRDLLQITSTRQMRTSRGERVAVIVYHSIAHRDFPEFKHHGIIRVQNSLSVVYRQLDNQRVEIFMKNFVDPMGKVPEMFITQDVAQALMTSGELPNIGFKIKLYHLMRGRHRQQALSSCDNHLLNLRQPTPCVSCEKVLGKLFSGSGAVCQLCYKLACSKCLVTKKIVVETTTTSNAMRPFEFCVGCIMMVRHVPAAAVARIERNLRVPGMGESFVAGSGSSTSSRLNLHASRLGALV